MPRIIRIMDNKLDIRPKDVLRSPYMLHDLINLAVYLIDAQRNIRAIYSVLNQQYNLLPAPSLELVQAMEGARPLSCFMMIIYLLICPLFVSTSTIESLVYNVGDSENWNTGVNYLSWLQKYNFSVGDTLGQHSVQPLSCIICQVGMI